MRILTWNVNGVRSLGTAREFNARLLELNADVICIQETKVTRDMLEEDLAVLKDFSAFFSFSRKKSGYSGVATFVKHEFRPVRAEEGLGGTLKPVLSNDLIEHYENLDVEFSPDELKQLDSEGRCIMTKHELKGGPSLVIINVYCPRADPEKPDRLVFKLKFFKLLEMRAQNLRKTGHHVIIVGDVNQSHKEIDHCDPYEDFSLAPGRKWLDHFLQPSTILDPEKTEQDLKSCVNLSSSDLKEVHFNNEWKTETFAQESHQFVDAFRYFHPNLLQMLKSCDIHPEINGSDHCPVSAVVDICVEPSSTNPTLCAKNFPEFVGKQQTLSKFFCVKEDQSNKRFLEEAKIKPTKKPKLSQQTKLSSFFVKVSTSSQQSSSQSSSDSLSETSSITEASLEFEQTRKNCSSSSSAMAWKAIFKGPPEAPLCKGHKEPAVLRTVKKKGPNAGRQFWCCGRGEGRADDPNARCDFFKWRK